MFSVECTAPLLSQGDHTVELVVQGRGKAALFSNSVTRSISYVMSITSIVPNIGSLEGGTNVVINGDGFDTFNGFDALIGGFLCAIRNGKEDQLICTTRTTTSTATSAVTSANGFAGDVSKTPTVASMTSTGTNTWSLKGTHFGTGKYSKRRERASRNGSTVVIVTVIFIS